MTDRIESSQRPRNIQFVLLFFLSVFLHQSSVIMGINISFADFFCLFLLISFLASNSLVIPTVPVLFFILVSVVTLTTSLFYSPVAFLTYPEPIKVFSEYSKLLVIMLYFIVGYQLTMTRQIDLVLKWFSYTGLIIALIGIGITLTGLREVFSSLFYGEIRFKGLMNDPNYFSILQLTALAYFSRIEGVPSRYVFAGSMIVILSVLLSGSKTGIITCFCYFVIRGFEYLFYSRKRVKSVLLAIFFSSFLLVLFPFLIGKMDFITNQIGAVIPSFERVKLLFSDFNTAITGNGSERAGTWEAALQVIQHSPLVGIGIGTYISIVSQWFDSTEIAHNTYLQLAAEWGIPLAALLFLCMFFLIMKTTLTKGLQCPRNLIMRDFLIIFLIGSLAISFNNARVMWFVLGGVVASLKKLHKRKKEL